MTFSPRWITPNSAPLDNTPVAEGNAFSMLLTAEDIWAETREWDSELVFVLPAATDVISLVRVNGSVLASQYLTRQGRTLIINLQAVTPTPVVSVEIKRTKALTFSLLLGQLPPGISLSPQGSLSGQLGNISANQVFSFTVRASNGKTVHDRAFSIRTTAIPKTSNWVYPRLPEEKTDTGLNIDYRDFGSFRRLDNFNIVLHTFNPDQETPTVELLPTGLTGTFEEGLPSGLVLTSNAISGRISPTARAGRYLFRLGFAGQTANRIYGRIDVSNESPIGSYVGAVIQWTTPEDLGYIKEADPCVIAVEAKAATPLTYSVAPGSSPLPPGLSINSATGALQGFAAHVPAETTYLFSIRAATTSSFSDRLFKLVVRNRYNTSETLDIKFKLRTTDGLGMSERYDDLLPSSAIYRADDPSFGIPAQPFLYLIKGLAGNIADAQSEETSPFGSDYHGRIALRVGQHRYAVARDQTGKVVYEVIYRAMVDNQEGAGGFQFGTNRAVEEKVLYPQSGQTPIYVHPKSLRNARMDFAKDLGFATGDASLKNLTGPEGVEAMPLWMSSPQIAGDPSSVLGYTPALVVAYVRPGLGASTIGMLNQATGLLPNGRSVVMEKYFVVEHINRGGTTWDDGTTFDNNETVFDPI